MNATSDLHGHTTPQPHHQVPEHHSLSIFQPFVWLSRGWDDLWHNPMASMGYGVIVSGMGILLIMMARHPYFLAAAISGFLLVGPILTTGLCELSRRRERGQNTDFDGSLEALVRNRSGLEHFAFALLALSIVWFLMSTFMLFQVMGNAAPDYGMAVWAMWDEIVEQISADQMISYMLVGGSLAVVVFALSVVSVPMLIDKNVKAGEAMRTSVRQTLIHLPTMTVWAALIAGLSLLGFMTFLLGMIIVFPLLGHATWHAYKDLTR